ncbi:hypothetical protein AB0K00_04425 [Dactylosporangium sp. NPDC049525]|uniref:hypothetical protein n=1 Tax=Dactylosporangium sp. NPDC049525 TaxID=3154730 RepID=UPI00341B9FB2
MGNRANYVVIAQGETVLGWSRWGATSIVADLLAGPAAATAALRPAEPPEPLPPDSVEALRWSGVTPVDELMTDVYCEGAALIDHDRRVLLAFEETDDYVTFVDGLAGLVEAWPGWHVRWAFDGVLDVAAYLGQDRGPLRDQRVPDQAGEQGLPAPFHGPGEVDPDRSEHWYEGVLSIRRPDGTVELYLASDDQTTIAWTTAAQVEALPPGFAHLERPELPRWGLHLDQAARAGGLWCMARLGGALIDLSPGWPGWTWTFWGGDLRRQLDACAGALRVPPLPARLRHLRTVGL